ncbi:MAG: hypothetical protein V1774_07035 [Candidatus Eisenbacteria bacterium]
MPDPVRTPRLLALAAAILLAVCAFAFSDLVVAFIRSDAGGMFDDAYMFVRYADHLRAGDGLVWNVGEEPAFGPTSLLYVPIVALARGAIALPMERLLPLVSAALGLLALIVIVAAGITLARPPSPLRALWLAAWVVPAVLAPAAFRYHLLTGMDTTLSLLTNALLLWALAAMVKRPDRTRLLAAAGAAYLTFLARPDNALYALLCPLLAVLLLVPHDRRRAALWNCLAPLAALFVADTLVKLWQLGTVLPLSHYVKRAGFYEGYANPGAWNPVAYVQTFLVAGLPFAIVLLAGAARRHMRWLIVCLLPVAATFAYYFSVTQIMGYEARFYYPALPFVAIPAAAVMDEVIGRLVRPRMPWLRFAAVVFLIALLLPGLTGLARWYGHAVLAPRFDEARYPLVQTTSEPAQPKASIPEQTPQEGIATPAEPPRLGAWRTRVLMAEIAARLPEGSVVAASEIGYLGARAPRVTIIDLSGLNDARIAREGVRVTGLIEREVDLVWMPHTDYRGIRRDILSDPLFAERFELFPGAFDYGLAIRRDSRRRNQILDAVRALGCFRKSPVLH